MAAARRRLIAAAVAAAAVYAAAVPWVFRPWFLASDALPHAASRPGPLTDADLHLNLWILAWVAHAAVEAPTRLFDGNAFHPATGVITGSENMLAHVPVTVPVLAATGNPLVVLKAVALESFALAGLAMFLLVHHHTGDAAAALLAGATYAFTPLRAQTAPWPQYFGTAYLPFAMLAVDVWLSRRRRRALVGLAAAVALQGLACVYVGYFTLLTLPLYAAVRLRALPAGERRRAAVPLGVAFASGALLLVPAALPYLAARRTGVIPPQPAELLPMGSLLPRLILHPNATGWIGIVAPVLVAGGLCATLWRRWGGAPRAPRGTPAAAAWALLALSAFLALGPYTELAGHWFPTPYLLLHRWLPGFATIRAPIRFLIVASAALSLLGGLALARAFAGRAAAVRWPVSAALVAVTVFTAAPHPVPTTPARFGRYAAPIHRALAARPPGEPVIEIPGQLAENDLVGIMHSARAMSWSAVHWQPLVNGYTAYEPPVAPLLRGIAVRLPQPAALQALVDVTGARWLVLRRGSLTGAQAVLWPPGTVPPGLRLEVAFDGDELYAITVPPRHDWSPLVQAHAGGSATTFAGTPKTPLAPGCRRGRIVAVLLPPLVYPLPVALPAAVRFVNEGDCIWPGIDVRADGLVVLRHRWRGPDGAQTRWSPPTRLVGDVPPGAVVDDVMAIAPPDTPVGRWTCEVELTQVGAAEPIARGSAETELAPFPAFPVPAGSTR